MGPCCSVISCGIIKYCRQMGSQGLHHRWTEKPSGYLSSDICQWRNEHSGRPNTIIWASWFLVVVVSPLILSTWPQTTRWVPHNPVEVKEKWDFESEQANDNFGASFKTPLASITAPLLTDAFILGTSSSVPSVGCLFCNVTSHLSTTPRGSVRWVWLFLSSSFRGQGGIY